MDSRLRYDRGNRREYDRADRDGGRHGRGDGSPSRDGPDDQMFDSFRGRGSNAPFSAEFPAPPILMPVPGAGYVKSYEFQYTLNRNFVAC